MKVENTQVVFHHAPVTAQSFSVLYEDNEWNGWVELWMNLRTALLRSASASAQQKQYKVTPISVSNLQALWYFFFYCDFFFVFSSPVLPRRSYLPLFFLLHSCVILTSEMPSVLTGEAAGEMGWIECQAGSMFKKKGKGKKKTPLLSLWRIFWQVVWFPQETFALKWEFPRGNAYVQKLPVSLSGAALHLSIFEQ